MKKSRAPKKSQPRGRPSDYSPKLAALICAEIASGKSVREICRADDMPSMVAVFRWIGIHEDFRKQYELATASRADVQAEEILEIADDGTNDFMQRIGKDGELSVVPNTEHIQRSRLRVDARKWLMSKTLPKKYGDRVASEITGKDGAPLIPELSDEEMTRRAAYVIAKALRGTLTPEKD